MGLENLKSVFNDLSENTLSEKGIHGGLTNERPSTPAHSDDHSLLDLLPNVPLLGPDNLSMSPTLEWKGRHGDKIIDKEGNVTTDIPHPTGHSTLDDLIKQTIPEKMDENSLLSTQDDKIEFNSYYDASFIGPYGGFSGEVTVDNNNPTQISFNPIGDRKKLRTGDEFLKLGINNRLGEGDLILETLYNVNHSAVIDRKDIVIRASSENWWDSTPNGNTGTIYTNRPGMGDKTLLDINRYRSGKLDNFRGFDRGNEPYIIKPIGSKDYTTLTSRDGLPLNRAKDDTSRLLKFYGTGAGLAFIAKENFTNVLFGNSNQLGRLDTLLAPPIPNPIQGNTGFLNVTNDYFQDLGGFVGSMRKPLTVEYSSGAGKWYFFKNHGDRGILLEQLQKIEVPTDQPKFVQKGLQKLKDAAIKKAAKSIQLPLIDKTPFIDLKGGPRPTSYDDRVNITAPTVHDNGIADTFTKGDFYVKIKDLRKGGKFLYFRGFVTGIVENVNPSWTPTNYIGRSEPVYMYERAERDLSFNLRVYPNNETEFSNMYEKIDYLTSLAYPKYLDEFNPMTGIKNPTRMQPPFTELYMAHIGSRVKGQFGFIKSLSYTVNETGDWDALQALPRLFDIAISYQILNRKPPEMDDKFYRASV